jgi:hypothetical protein
MRARGRGKVNRIRTEAQGEEDKIRDAITEMKMMRMAMKKKRKPLGQIGLGGMLQKADTHSHAYIIHSNIISSTRTHALDFPCQFVRNV